MEISESRPRPCRMAHCWVSKKWLKATWSWLERGTGSSGAKHARLCCKGMEILTARRSLAQGPVEHDTPESDEDWMQRLKKDTNMARTTTKGIPAQPGRLGHELVGDGHEARKVLMSGQPFLR